MGRTKQQAKSDEKDKKSSISNKKQEQTTVMKQLCLPIMIGIFVAVVGYYLMPLDMKNQIHGDYGTLSENLDLNKVHKHFKKYTESVVYQTVEEQFKDRELTEQIVKLFHEYIHVDLHPTLHYDTGMAFNKGHLGLKNDQQYCVKSDILKLQHPEITLKNYFILSDFQASELPRQIVRDFGVDVMPNIYMGMSTYYNDQRLYVKTALIHSRISRFHHFHHFGECLFCVFQTSNHIPGKWSITGKDLVINNYRSYTASEFFDNKKCLETITYMPKSYRLYNKQECQSFFRYIDSDEYKQKQNEMNVQFIMKEGRDIHRGEGITLFSPEVEQEYRFKYVNSSYDNGKKCNNKKVMQAQTYVHNPMLYKGNKIEVRIYFLIASTNPLIIYSQNLAHLRMCAVPYDLHSSAKEVHVCNTAITKNQGNTNFVIDFPLEGLQDYLIQEGKISNPNWLNEVVYPQIYQALIHLTRSGEHEFLIDSRVNENFAIDFLLDDTSKIWFLENNPNPQILRVSDSRVQRHYIMHGDKFEIQFAYLRSRFVRLRKIAIEMKEMLTKNTFDKELYRQKFEKANKNFLEAEFEPSKDNTYIKIYDENLPGKERFMGFLPEACLYKE